MPKVRTSYPAMFVAAACLLLGQTLVEGQVRREHPTEAIVTVTSNGLSWATEVPYTRAILTVTGPDLSVLREGLDPEQALGFNPANWPGGPLEDGGYRYELQLLRPATVEELIADGRTADAFGLPGGPGGEGEAERVVLRKIGHFSLEGGAIVDGEEDEAMALDQVINDDLIVIGSACVGFDCVNGESFGFDTLRIKENNLRLHFWDTSNSASFPTNDWRIVVNDSSNGGANYFSIEDSDAGRRVFTVEAGAPSNSLYVDSSGRVGIKTDNPVVEFHIRSGNTPTVRMEQDGSSGFTPQIWDVAGNEAGFFVRDATNGSKLPFRIRPDAPASSIDIRASGDVGFGESSPKASIHVLRSNGTARILVQELSATAANRELLALENNGHAQVSLRNTETGNTWKLGANEVNGQADAFTLSRKGTGGSEFAILQNGEVRMGPGATTTFLLSANGNLQIGGSLDQTSSRHAKENIELADPRAVLERLERMPVSVWSYKSDESAVRHMGPMAEDFRQAFGLGTDERHLAPSDAAGVALAAIQGLNRRVEDKDRQIDELSARVEQLEYLIEELACERAHRTGVEISPVGNTR